MKWAQRALFVLLPLPVLGAVVLYLAVYAQAGPDVGAEVQAELYRVGILLLLLVLTLALTVPLIHSSMQAMQTRLGTDGRRLYIRWIDGREIAVDPSAVAWTDRMILYRDSSLPLTGGRQRPLYAPGEVEIWLGPLLRQARRVGPLQALEHRWKYGSRAPLLWLAGAAVFGTIAAIVITAR